jgi:hypothetical protein
VTTRTVHLAVDVRVDEDEISGNVGDGRGQPRPFHGWLGLLAALNELLAVSPPAPGCHE